MLTNAEVQTLCQRLGCSPEAPDVVAAIQAAPPARRVGSRAGNVSVRYPSRKMGVVIQAESHRNELAAVYALEHDPETLAFYDQPPALKLTYQARHGRRVGVLHTPDFFVIRTDSIAWEEWKLEAELERLAMLMPARYVRTATGWLCPPGAEVAATWGFTYRVRSSVEIDWVFQRNLQFLSDYLHPSCPPVDPAITAHVLARVSTQPGSALAELLVAEQAWSNDQIYILLAQEQLYVDLHAAPLAEPERVRVFRDSLSAQALALLRTPIVVGPAGLALPTVSADPVTSLAPAPDEVVGPADGTPPTRGGQELLARANPAALAEANRRYALITPRLHGQAVPEGGPPARTLRLWLAAYRAAEARYGAGYLGLLPRSAERGNRTSRLSAATHQLLAEVITTWYETPTQPSKLAVYGLLKACAERGLLAPSYATFAHHPQPSALHANPAPPRGACGLYPGARVLGDQPHHPAPRRPPV